MSLLKCIDTRKVKILETQKQQWTMEVANISPAIFITFEHNMLLLYIGYFLNISLIFPYFYSYNKTKYDTKSQRWYSRKLVPLKISALNCFGVCTDSQNRGNSVDHHIYTSHYLRFEHGFLLLLRICFCRDSSLFCRDFSLFCCGFFFVLPWVFFI